MQDDNRNEEMKFENDYNDYMDFKESEELKPEAIRSKKKKDDFTKTVIYQLIICVFMLSAFCGLKFMVPEKYDTVKTYLQTNLSGQNFAEGMGDLWNNLLDSISKLTPLKPKTESEQSQQSTQSEQPKEEASKQEQPKEEVSKQEEKGKQELQKEDAPKEDGDINTVEITKNFIVPLMGRITSGFGERENPLGGPPDFHNGIDIGASEGTPIYSVYGGVVEQKSFSDNSGNFLTISHSDEVKSFYAHCSEILVEEGKEVQKGEEIAKSGRTGNVTGPHLHFGIKYKGKWVNPVSIFPQMA